MKIYLKVPYTQRREARVRGALWEPSTKRWYVVSAPAWLRCKAWSVPLSAEEKAYLADPVRETTYAKALRQFYRQEAPIPE